MNANGRTRLQHMVDAAAEALGFIKERGPEDLLRDRMLLLALVKEIEIIGEASTQLSEEFRSSHPEVLWAMIRGMRNRLIHAYADVELELVWSTITEELPELLRALEPLRAEQ